jgi:hypothetical protein
MGDLKYVYGTSVPDWVEDFYISEEEKCEVGGLLEFASGRLNDVELLKLCHIDVAGYLRVKVRDIGMWINEIRWDEEESFEGLYNAFSRLHGEDSGVDFRRFIGFIMRMEGLPKIPAIIEILNQKYGNVHAWEPFMVFMESRIGVRRPGEQNGNNIWG